MSQGKKLDAGFWNNIFTEALKNNLGIVTHACSKTGITPQCYYEYRLRNPLFGKSIDAIKEQICLPILEDLAQARAIKDNDRLLMFMLRTLGGAKWNRDRIEDAMAKIEPQLRREAKYASPEHEQRLPTRAEKAAAKAYLAALDEEEDEVGEGDKVKAKAGKRIPKF